MIISKGLDSTIIGAHTPNIILLSEVSEYVDIEATIVSHGKTTVFNFRKSADVSNKVRFNVIELTKSIYKTYIDPFDYVTDVAYDRFSNYNIGRLSLKFTDSQEEILTIEKVDIINGVLQVNSCVIVPEFCGKRLGYIPPEMTLVETEGGDLNFDLNRDLNG